MATPTRSVSDPSRVVSWTDEIMVLPNKYGTISQLGLFTEEGVGNNTVQFEVTTVGSGVLTAVPRGARGQVNANRASLIKSWAIPHFNLTDEIHPSDIHDRRAFGSPDMEDSLNAARTRKLVDMKAKLQRTQDLARATLLNSGVVYGTSLNMFTEFGVTQNSVDFVLGTGTTDVIGKCSSVVAYAEDNATGSFFSGLVGLASPEFFAALVGHAKVTAAYAYYKDGDQQPLRNRLGLIGAQQVFHFGGIDWVEVRGSIDGTNRIIAAKHAVVVPTGSDIFKTYFGVADRFDAIGGTGQAMYAFERMSEDQASYILQAETNPLNACVKPQLIQDVFFA